MHHHIFVVVVVVLWEGGGGMLRTVYVSVFLFFINCVCFVFIHIMPCYSLLAFVVFFKHWL